MSWVDDRRAAAFISSHDGAVQRFARPNSNDRYAQSVFTVLKAYGINYVIDPSSAFVDNIETEAVDFLQFPYQTLLYHGGDCDDLTILNCSKSEADSSYGSGRYVWQNNKAWILVEITFSQDTYGLATQLGMKQWNKYPKERLLISVADAWKKYKPVSVPESDISVIFPKDALR